MSYMYAGIKCKLQKIRQENKNKIDYHWKTIWMNGVNCTCHKYLIISVFISPCIGTEKNKEFTDIFLTATQ